MNNYPSNRQFPFGRPESNIDNVGARFNPHTNRMPNRFINMPPRMPAGSQPYSYSGNRMQNQFQQNMLPFADQPRIPFRPDSWLLGKGPIYQDSSRPQMPGAFNVPSNVAEFKGSQNIDMNAGYQDKQGFGRAEHGGRLPMVMDNYPRFRMPGFPPPVPLNMSLNRPPWLAKEGYVEATPMSENSPSQSYHSDENVNDNEFVKKWLSQRDIKRSSMEVEGNCKIRLQQFQDDLKSYLKCISELQLCRDVLLRFANTDEDEWQEVVEKTESIKENLQVLQAKLFESDYLMAVNKKLKKVQKKRERQRNARERRAKEKLENKRRTILLHKKIDEWRHEIVSKINAKKMVDSLKSDAGQSLAEVRRKIVDGSKWLEKVDGTVELRGIRRQTALQRGIFVFGDQDKKFEERLGKMREIIKQRLDIYKDEEKTLKVMLEEEHEQLKREDDSKRKALMEKEYLRLFGYNPLLECRRYWLQAEENPMSLVQIRRLWDVHLVPDGDPIPDGWVSPEINKNPSWNKYLKRKK
ncbi:programmed cell death protein 7-like [Rhopilema esculentum]|uniref:programmed cell death protein 7-like n=1 Tax=Rhopilema esculentum TaxID=499914 RepID=UPI0031D1A7CF|eukprot:gene6026-11398_t